MANYLFEQMTDAQAADYDPATDSLFFLTGSPATVQVTYNAAEGLNLASLTLTNNGISHTFHADALAGESLTFFGASSSDVLAFGADSTADGTSATPIQLAGTAGSGSRYFALGGDDFVHGSAANDTIYGGLGDDTITGLSSHQNSHGDYTESDYLNGGAGADTITGGIGNDHLYGNEQTTVAGTDDDGDSLNGGDGNDYVQGNAGDDTILGGNGNDKLYGGADDDSIHGGNGHDYLQGNHGADSLFGDDGNDTIHGGADNDWLDGGNGNDQLFGDLGDDTLVGSAGIDTLTGGDGSDVFQFHSALDISNLGTAATAAHHDQLTTIMDFTHGTDTFDLGTGITGDVATVATNFANIDDAYSSAQTYIGAHGTDVDALQVGTDTVLFWDSTGGGTIDSAVILHGVTASTLDNDDFGL